MELKDTIQLATTVVGMLVGPWLAVKLSMKQFRSQKWWERQGDVYVQVLENLAVVKHCVSARLAYEEHPEYMLGPSTILEAESGPAAAKLVQIAAMGPYYLSEGASSALDKFIHTTGFDDGCGPVDEYQRQLKALNNAIEVIRSEARKSSKVSFWS